MIRIKRKRKNPNLKGEEFIDDIFMNFLMDAITTARLGKSNKYIGWALIYKNIGMKKCEDCSDNNIEIFYDECECERCEECDFNKCTC